MGKYAHRGYRDAVPFGLWTTAVIVVSTLTAIAIYEMLRRATRLEYDGVMEALEGVFEQAGELFFIALESPEGIIILFVGGILAAWFSVWAAVRWK